MTLAEKIDALEVQQARLFRLVELRMRSTGDKQTVNIEPFLPHIPSPYYNRGANDGGDYLNYGRLECDILHHVSAAVWSIFSIAGKPDTGKDHIDVARKLLDRLEEYVTIMNSIAGKGEEGKGHEDGNVVR